VFHLPQKLFDKILSHVQISYKRALSFYVGHSILLSSYYILFSLPISGHLFYIMVHSNHQHLVSIFFRNMVPTFPTNAITQTLQYAYISGVTLSSHANHWIVHLKKQQPWSVTFLREIWGFNGSNNMCHKYKGSTFLQDVDQVLPNYTMPQHIKYSPILIPSLIILWLKWNCISTLE